MSIRFEGDLAIDGVARHNFLFANRIVSPQRFSEDGAIFMNTGNLFMQIERSGMNVRAINFACFTFPQASYCNEVATDFWDDCIAVNVQIETTKEDLPRDVPGESRFIVYRGGMFLNVPPKGIYCVSTLRYVGEREKHTILELGKFVNVRLTVTPRESPNG